MNEKNENNEKKEKKEKKKTITSRIFNICQYERHPNSGEILLTELQIKNTLERYKTLKRWAYIYHDKDVYVPEDEPEHVAGDLKPAHYHIVIECDSAIALEQISKWFNIPSNYIHLPKGGKRAFLDCIQYLTHEDEKQQLLGKHLYFDDEVRSNFDFREFIENFNLDKSEKLKRGIFENKKEELRYRVAYEGMTLNYAYDNYYMDYINDLDMLKKLRGEYLARRAAMPLVRLNYYITGGGGDGKGILSRALARNLMPNIPDEDLFFVAGAKNALLEGYDGQPIIIWDDMRASDLLTRLDGRGNVFALFDPHPVRQRQNIKYGSVCLPNAINIVNSVEDYTVFLNGLAGAYTDKYGNIHKSEDLNQSYRRFPFIMPIDKDQIIMMINKGFVQEGSYTEYEVFARIKSGVYAIKEKYGKTPELEQKIMEKVLTPQVEKHTSVLSHFDKETISDEEQEKILASIDDLIVDERAIINNNQKLKEQIKNETDKELPF